MKSKIKNIILILIFSVLSTMAEDNDIIVNGDFTTDSDWKNTLGSRWSIQDGQAVLDSNSADLSMWSNVSSTGLEQGKTYRVTWDIISCDDYEKVGLFMEADHPARKNMGELYFADLGINTPGTHTMDFTISGDLNYPMRFIVGWNADTVTAVIDNVSVTEVVENANQVPIVNAGEDRVIIEGVNATLKGSAEDNDGTIISYEWKDGDDVIGTTASLDVSGWQTGIYNLVFSAIDNDGATQSDTMILTIEAQDNNGDTDAKILYQSSDDQKTFQGELNSILIHNGTYSEKLQGGQFYSHNSFSKFGNLNDLLKGSDDKFTKFTYRAYINDNNALSQMYRIGVRFGNNEDGWYESTFFSSTFTYIDAGWQELSFEFSEIVNEQLALGNNYLTRFFIQSYNGNEYVEYYIDDISLEYETLLSNGNPVDNSGDDLIVNGDFATDSDWINILGSRWSIQDGQAVLDSNSADLSLWRNATGGKLNQGKTYRVTWDIISCDDYEKVGLFMEADHPARKNMGELYFSDLGITAPGTYTMDFTISGDLNYPMMFVVGWNADTVTAVIDNVSVTEVDDLIVNGDFATDSDWINILGSRWSIQDGQAVLDSNSADLSLWRNATGGKLNQGKTYRVTWDIISCDDYEKVGLFMEADHPARKNMGELYFSDLGITAPGTYTMDFTISGDLNYPMMFVVGWNADTVTAVIDNVSVTEVVENANQGIGE